MRIIILGAGPTGLGAALRLNELGHDDWELWESASDAGGLAGSVTDPHGFTWDMGGHVQFSHYARFDALMDDALGPDGWLHHERESWVRILGTWVPYPFQYNLHRLPEHERDRCVAGLRMAARNASPAPFTDFADLIRRVFGEGIDRCFMTPYNFKVWAWPPSELSAGWIGERVALPDLAKVEESIRTGLDNVSWGPNNTFRFPRKGGTGAIWRALADRLPPGRLRFNRRAVAIDTAARTVLSDDGVEARYDALVSTIPLDTLAGLTRRDDLAAAARGLRHSSTHIFGVALHGSPGDDLRKKCWMYFPEDDAPFYRVTVFSHYSPFNVPDIARHWSLMAEVSESPVKPVNAATLGDEVIQGMINTGLITGRSQVHHVWSTRLERGYPTPSLGRDDALGRLLPVLDALGVYSRGRFGAWKYEVSNQDHSCMQGIEVVDRILSGADEPTLNDPNLVNSMAFAARGA